MKKIHWFVILLFILISVTISYLVICYVVPKVLPVSIVKNSSLHGVLWQNQTWEGNIYIDGDVFALPGVSVTITPGTVIKVAANGDKFNLNWWPWLLKSGINMEENKYQVLTNEPFWDEFHKISINLARVRAVGLKNTPIYILSDTERPGSPYEINKISVQSGVLAHVYASNYRRLEIGTSVVVRDSNLYNVGECAVCISSGSPAVINNTFERALREYVSIKHASPRITDNNFGNSPGKGITADPERVGNPIISYNNFEMPDSVAIDFLTGGEDIGGVISYNFISGNTKIFLPCDSRVTIAENNLGAVIGFKDIGCAGTYNFAPNYWGTQDRETILNERILNKIPNFTVGIPTILKKLPTQIGPRK